MIQKVGGFRYADYCPIAEVYSNVKWHCKTGVEELSSLGEVMSSTSNCFMISLGVNKDTKLPYLVPICYPFRCDFANKIAIITVDRTEVVCPTQGGKQNARDSIKPIECPSFNEICPAQPFCLNMIECIEKKSVIFE